MPKIELKIPPDSTFLSSVFYEGTLFTAFNSNCKFIGSSLEISESDICEVFSKLEDGRIDLLRIKMTGNDNKNVVELLEAFGIKESRKTFRELVRLLKTNSNKLKVERDVEIGLAIEKETTFVDFENANITAPQLFKIDRYTGISSLEMGLTSKQLTLKISPEAAIVGLLGIYSAFVSSVRQQDKQYYYFLFFSPDDAAQLLYSGNAGRLRSFMLVKEGVIERLRDVLRFSTLAELILLETLLNVEIQKLLVEENLEKVSLVLFKIAPEGNTYKIYEQTPIEIYRNPPFYQLISKNFKDPVKFCEMLSKELEQDGVIGKTLLDFAENRRGDDADKIFRAVKELYRFVVLGDAQGWFGFLKEIHNAYRSIQLEKKARSYLNLLSNFSWL